MDVMKPCPACTKSCAQPFFELRGMPVNIGVQWPTTEAARACKRGDLCLKFCSQCGFIWNAAFEPGRLEYSQRYDNSLDFSPVFQDYARNLARRLIDTYDIRGKEVVELGCGKGHFLTLLCEEGENSGIGFDPSYDGARVQSPTAQRIRYVQDFYGEPHTRHEGDLICCRHVLEHIPDPFHFLSMVRATIGDRRSTVVYFEVPNARFILEKLSIWDIIYEHCNYFSSESLAGLFRRCGFEVLRLEETYEGQFLSLDARLTKPGNSRLPAPGDITELAAAVDRFSDTVRDRSQAWDARLTRWQHDECRVAVWGAGAKAVSFLNMLGIGDIIPFVVDINPNKQGRFLPGTGQQIVEPAFLKEFQPQSIVLMNPIYHQEVQEQLSSMGLAAELLDV